MGQPSWLTALPRYVVMETDTKVLLWKISWRYKFSDFGSLWSSDSLALISSIIWWFSRDLLRGALMWIVSRLTFTHLTFMVSLAAAEDVPGSLIVVPDTCCCRLIWHPDFCFCFTLRSAEWGRLEDNQPSLNLTNHHLSNINARISWSPHPGGFFAVRFRLVLCHLCGCPLPSNCLTCAWLHPPPPRLFKAPAPACYVFCFISLETLCIVLHLFIWNPAGVGFEGSKSFSLMVLKQVLSKCPAELHVNWSGRSAEAVNKSEGYLHNKWKQYSASKRQHHFNCS